MRDVDLPAVLNCQMRSLSAYQHSSANGGVLDTYNQAKAEGKQRAAACRQRVAESNGHANSSSIIGGNVLVTTKQQFVCVKRAMDLLAAAGSDEQQSQKIIGGLVAMVQGTGDIALSKCVMGQGLF